MRIVRTLALALSAATAAAQPPATSPSPSAVSPSATAGQSPSPAPTASPSVKPFAIERWTWGMEADGPPPVRTVEVRNDFGDIRVRFAGDRRIEASAAIQRLGPGPEDVGVTVERRGGAVVLTVTYPPGRIRDADPQPSKTSMDRLDLTLYLPEGVSLNARTFRGMVEARAVRSDVAAETLDGDITIITRRSAWARTAGGAMRVTLDADVAGGPNLLVSETGKIVLTLSAGVGVDLRAETGGAIRAGAPVAVRQENGRSRAAGVIGVRRREVQIYSASGEVSIERPAP